MLADSKTRPKIYSMSIRFPLEMVNKAKLNDPNQNIYEDERKTYFNADELDKPSNEYVAWVDLMGTKAWLLRSIDHAANHIFKLHGSLTNTLYRLDTGEEIRVYSAMDGFYIVSGEREQLVEILEEVFATMARSVIDRLYGDEENILYMPVIRGAIAYGPVIHGSDLHQEASGSNPLDYTLSHEESLVDEENLMIGDPISQSFDKESQAPPYGLYICESARGFSHTDTEPFDRVWLDWFHSRFGSSDYQEIAGLLRKLLFEYYTWCNNNSGRIRYPEERREEHEIWMEQYLPEIDI